MLRAIFRAGGAALLVVTSATAYARDFTVASWGGAYQEAQKKVFFTPFAEGTGMKLVEDVYNGGWGQFQAMQTSGKIPWDIVQLETAELIRGCEEGVFAKIDWSKFGGQGDLLPEAQLPCGIGAVVGSTIIAYNADLLKEPPQTSADFFNLVKFPGKRGLRNGPKTNLEFALMADGVLPADVYKTLSTAAGVDRAFAKLDSIKSSIQWWEAGAQPQEWLAGGDVAMTTAYNGRVSAAVKEGRHFGIVWSGGTFGMDYWAIPVGAEHADVSYQFLKFMNDTSRQVAFAQLIPYGQPRADVAKAVDPKLAAELPAGENIARQLFVGGEQSNDFWVDNGDTLQQRWDAWAAKK
ncbi:ABC transporter substrate-binding protein [Mesorhizobium sp. B2-4-13]|uniref:ABC transporter substrate-binding protein n=1 Tax=Mesorhizobium sp. B2-4-13 TaxID=2589936 RepID=UPI001152D83D|nr:ABC transporter substrate-binding protein [Mesorhizobium sp. B2-4-13]TPK87033.1 ABC transporter substrate-binding protein [Mesorhizobium sp. B2-4-13]